MSNFSCLTTINLQKQFVAYRFLLAFLFDHIGKDFSLRLSLSVQQTGRYCSLGSLFIILLFGVSLFMHLDTAMKKEKNSK